MENELPKGWKIQPLKDVVTSMKGKKPKILSELPFDNSIPYIDIKALEKDLIEQYADIGSSKSFSPNDIAVVWDGARCGWVAKAKEGAIGSTICALTPLDIESNYLYYFLLSKYSLVNSKSRGVGIPHIDPTLFWNMEVPIPLPKEQKKIAEKLDKLFGQIESIKKSIERIPELLKNFRQQILTYAVTGKLTEDYCNSLCYMDLQEIILQLKEQRINQLSIKSAKDKLEKIYSDDNSSLDFPIPKQWIPVNIDKVCDSFTYGTSAKSENEGKYPVIRMGNIQNGKLDWSDLKYTSDESEYMKYKLNIGDILFNRTNSPELVGKTTIYDGNRAACYAGYIIKIDPYRKYVNPYYLNIVLNSQYAKRWCWENKTDGVSQSNINAQKISKFTIPYPSLSEQEEIVNRVQSLFTKLDIVEKRYAALCDILDKLPQAILNKAFKGKLL